MAARQSENASLAVAWRRLRRFPPLNWGGFSGVTTLFMWRLRRAVWRKPSGLRRGGFLAFPRQKCLNPKAGRVMRRLNVYQMIGFKAANE